MKIVVILNACTRILETRESIKLYRKLFSELNIDGKIILLYNGIKEIQDIANSVDLLEIRPNMPHYSGALFLINDGIRVCLEKYPNVDAIICSSGDVRVTVNFIQENLRYFVRKKVDILTSLWTLIGLSTEFFIVSEIAARKLFPFGNFVNNNRLLNWLFFEFGKKIDFGSVEFLFLLKVISKTLQIRLRFLPLRKIVIPIINRFRSKGYDSSPMS